MREGAGTIRDMVRRGGAPPAVGSHTPDLHTGSGGLWSVFEHTLVCTQRMAAASWVDVDFAA